MIRSSASLTVSAARVSAWVTNSLEFNRSRSSSSAIDLVRRASLAAVFRIWSFWDRTSSADRISSGIVRRNWSTNSMTFFLSTRIFPLTGTDLLVSTRVSKRSMMFMISMIAPLPGHYPSSTGDSNLE